MKKGIILIAIGIIFLALDFYIPMGEAYPPMEVIEELGEVLQGKIINNIIGTRPMIDVISDIIGYAFLFLGALFIVKFDSKIIFGLILMPLEIFLYITTVRLPYNTGIDYRSLYLKMAGDHFIITFLEIMIELLIIKSVIKAVQCLQTKWNVNELYIGWALAMTSKGILSGIHFFFGRGIFYYIYSLVMIGATLFYLNRLFVVTKFKLEENS